MTLRTPGDSVTDNHEDRTDGLDVAEKILLQLLGIEPRSSSA
jgi:hypothetical protein